MPMHDWTRVEPAIFHAFHHGWISMLSGALNTALPPEEYYALAEQHAAGFGPDLRTVPARVVGRETGSESDIEFYRRKKSSIAIRHVSGDRFVAMIDILSLGNKASRHAFRDCVATACKLLEQRIHLLLVDPYPPGSHDPNGIHAAIWEELDDEPFLLTADKPLTVVTYECDMTTQAYFDSIAVGDPLPDMPVFLESKRYVMVPLEATYQAAFALLPRRWRRVLEGT